MGPVSEWFVSMEDEMTTFTPEQIEERARELHRIRERNASRHLGRNFVPTAFDGVERSFCMSEAARILEIEAYYEQRAADAIASMAHLSDVALEERIDTINYWRQQPSYRIATSTHHQDLHFDELTSLRKERARRARAERSEAMKVAAE